MSSAPGAPPGSRVVTTVSPAARKASARRRNCVDLPPPSPPSKVMKRSGCAGGAAAGISPSVFAEDEMLQHGDNPTGEAELRHVGGRHDRRGVVRHARDLDNQLA